MTYTYKCDMCGEFDVEQSIKDDPLSECPNCGFECITRLISGSGSFVLKGGGWAADNYSKKKDQ